MINTNFTYTRTNQNITNTTRYTETKDSLFVCDLLYILRSSNLLMINSSLLIKKLHNFRVSISPL
jgi:hypothetical protein